MRHCERSVAILNPWIAGQARGLRAMTLCVSSINYVLISTR